MIRRIALSLALLLATTFPTAEASEPGRRRPVTNPQATVDGVIASVTPEGFRVQTPAGPVSVGVTPATEIVRTANAFAGPREPCSVSSAIAPGVRTCQVFRLSPYGAPLPYNFTPKHRILN